MNGRNEAAGTWRETMMITGGLWNHIFIGRAGHGTISDNNLPLQPANEYPVGTVASRQDMPTGEKKIVVRRGGRKVWQDK